MVVFLFGFYLWEYLITFWFEWSLITRKITFKWYYISYLMGRYCMVCVVCLLFSIDRIMQAINCKIVHPLITTLGLLASACATTNLMIRTVIIWDYNKWVMVPLAVMSCGQFFFSLYAGTTYAVAFWDTTLRTCLFQYEHYSHMASVYMYTTIYDLIILILTYLRIQRSNTNSRLWSTLRDQGILYFVFTSCVNIVAAIIIWLHLSDGMNAVVSPPATAISVILSSQSVISLMRLNKPSDTDTHSCASQHDRERDTKYGTQQLTTQIEFPTSIYGNNSFELARGGGGGGLISLSQSPMSSVHHMESPSSSCPIHIYPPPTLPPPVASSSKHKL